MSLRGTATRQDRAALGIAMMLSAWVLFSLVDTTVKWLVLAGLPATQLAFVRYAVAFSISLSVGAGTGQAFGRIDRRQAALLLLRGGLLVSATVSNFFALRFLPLSVVSAIMFSSPILVCALSVPLLGERVGPWRWSAIFLGFAGVVFVFRPFGEDFHWASLLILYNATALALFSIITRRLSGEISPQVMQNYMGALGTVALLPLAIWTWKMPASPLEWALLPAIGAFAWAGHEIFARAHLFADASALMPFAYSYLIYMSLAGWVVFSEVPDGLTVAGAGIIVVSGLIIWWRETMVRRT